MRTEFVDHLAVRPVRQGPPWWEKHLGTVLAVFGVTVVVVCFLVR